MMICVLLFENASLPLIVIVLRKRFAGNYTKQASVRPCVCVSCFLRIWLPNAHGSYSTLVPFLTG